MLWSIYSHSLDLNHEKIIRGIYNQNLSVYTLKGSNFFGCKQKINVGCSWWLFSNSKSSEVGILVIWFIVHRFYTRAMNILITKLCLKLIVARSNMNYDTESQPSQKDNNVSWDWESAETKSQLKLRVSWDWGSAETESHLRQWVSRDWESAETESQLRLRVTTAAADN